MNPTITQPNSQELNGDQAKTSLGIATFLMDKLHQPQASQTQEMAQPEPQMQEPQKDPMAEMMSLKDEIMAELQNVREDIKLVSQGDPKNERSEINDLKKQIEEVLNEPD